MLTKGIQASTRKDGPFDGLTKQLMKQKEEQRKQADLFSQNMGVVNANAASLGKKHLGVVQTWTDGIEQMMGYYAQKPSDEVKRTIANQMAMVNQYITSAKELQNVNNASLASVMEDPTAYIDTLDKATAEYNRIHNEPYQNLTFDPLKGVLMSDGESEPVSVFQDKYINGSDALVFMKRGLLEKVDPIGTYAAENYDKFAAVKTEDLLSSVENAFMAAQGEEELGQRAVSHYLQSQGKLNAIRSEEQLNNLMAQTLADPEEYEKALKWYAGEEAKAMQKSRMDEQAKLAADKKAAEDKIFQGYFDPEGDLEIADIQASSIEGLPSIDGIDWETADRDVIHEANISTVGFKDMKVFTNPVDHSVAPALLGEDERIVAVNVGADGNFYVLREEIVPGEGTSMTDSTVGTDTEDQIKQYVEVLDPESDIARTIIEYRGGKDTYASLLRQSIENSARERDRRVKEKWERVKTAQETRQQEAAPASQEMEIVQPTQQTPTNEERVEAMFESGALGKQSPMTSDVNSTNVWDDNIFTRGNAKRENPYMYRVARALINRGYNEQQIAETLNSPQFATSLENAGLNRRAGILNRAASNVIDAIMPGKWESGYAKDLKAMTNIAENMIKGVEPTPQQTPTEEVAGPAASPEVTSEPKTQVEIPKTNGEPEILDLGSTIPIVDEGELQLKTDAIQQAHADTINSLKASLPIDYAPNDELTSIGQDVINNNPDVLQNPISFILRNHYSLDENNIDHQATIAGFFKNAGATNIGGRDVSMQPALVTADTFAWCGAFADHVLTNVGAGRLRTSDNFDRLRARKYVDLGEPIAQGWDGVDKAKPGDIVVIEGPEGAHVAFFTEAKGGDIYLLGGNQSDQVKVAKFSPDSTKILAINRLNAEMGALTQGERDFLAEEINIAYQSKQSTSTTR